MHCVGHTLNKQNGVARTMQWTEWRSPRLAQELDQSEITMQGTGVRVWTSTQPVRSISTSFGTFVTEQSNAVQFLDFGFEQGIIVGIELELRSRRNARIQDRTIQLVFQNKEISENRANFAAENVQRYGGEFDRWGIPSTTAIPVESQEFGIFIDLQPHLTIPCSDTVYIDSVQMRVAYPLIP